MCSSLCDDYIVLGNCYKLPYDQEELSRLNKFLVYFSYRSNYPEIIIYKSKAISKYSLEANLECFKSSIIRTGIKNDNGWACMIRCGQMLIANTLHLAKGLYKTSQDIDVIEMFLDSPQYPFSIHNIVACANYYNITKPGEWFGPNTISRTFQYLINQIKSFNFTIYIPINCTIYHSDISVEKPVLMLIPLRLGTKKVNSKYYPLLKQCLANRYTVGILGGSPNHALYIIGYSEKQFYCMDPHMIQGYKTQQDHINENFKSFKCNDFKKLPISSLDPSLTIGFYLSKKSDIEIWIHDMLKSKVANQPDCSLFSISNSEQSIPQEIKQFNSVYNDYALF